MKEILLTGTVGDIWWDDNSITAKKVRDAFNDVQDTEIRLTVDSMGGDFYEMITIYNIIRDYARNHPETKIETYIQGSAMSAASMIALAAKDGNNSNQIKVEDNSLFLIHNAWTIVQGNQNELKAETRVLARIDEMQKDIYERKTGKTRAELEKIMEKGDFMYGQEIVDNGFADEVIASQKIDDFNGEVYTCSRDEKIISAKCCYDQMVKKMREVNEKNRTSHQTSFEAAGKILALNTTFESSGEHINNDKPDTNGEENLMNEEELKSKYPELYAAVFDAGVKAERSRVQSHIKMATDSGDINACVDFIASGVNCSADEVTAKYHEVFTKCAMAKMRASDNVNPINQPKTEDEGEKALVEAFERETGLKA